MDSSNWINLGLLIIAAIAALIAWLGFRDARRARAAVAEAAAEIRRPWEFSTFDEPTSDQRWTVKNTTGGHAYNVHLGSPAGFDDDWLELPGAAEDDVAPGAEIAFTFLRRLSSPKSATVSVFWTPGDGSPQKQFTDTIS